MTSKDPNVGEEFEDQDWRQRGQRLIRITGVYWNAGLFPTSPGETVYLYETTGHRKPKMIGRTGRIKEKTLNRRYRQVSH